MFGALDPSPTLRMNLPALLLPSNRSRRIGAGFAAIVAFFAGLLPSRADAFERQWHAGASLGYMALLGTSPRTLHGVGGGVHLAYGLNDTFNLLGELNVAGFPSGHTLVTGGGVGASYIFDVLQWVPHIGAIVGAYDVIDTSGECNKYCHSLRLNLEIPAGLDYTVTRSLAVGVAGRYQLLISGYSPAHVIGAFARVEILWGY
jgi:hypothetical protein